METTNVAVVTYGANTKEGREFAYKCRNDEWPLYMPIDIRRTMPTDPKEAKKFKVAHDHNSDFEDTQKNLLNDKRFSEAVSLVCNTIANLRDAEADEYGCLSGLSKILAVKCTSGTHRADGVCKAAARLVLNMLKVDDLRIYNVNVFSLTGAQDIESVLADARTWLDEPWELAEYNEKFMRCAASSSPQAKAVYNEILDLQADMRILEVERVDDIARMSSSKDRGRGTKRRSTDSENDDQFRCPTCEGHGYIAQDIPPWATFFKSAEAVYSTLRAYGIDDGAMQQAFSLVQQCGDDGIDKLRGITTNLWKNYRYIDNPSAFVTSACLRYK